MLPRSHLVDSKQVTSPTNRSRFTPDLPPELWRPIFIDATSFAPSFSAGFNLAEFHEARQRNLDTQRSLSLVCKMWHAIVLPLLYGSIWLDNPQMACHFLRTLVNSASTSPGVTTDAGYGKLVRSLVIPQSNQPSIWADFRIADVLNRCTDIHMIAKQGEFIPDFWHGIACTTSCLTCPTLGSFSSLRHVFWICSPDPETIPIDAQRLITLIQHAPNLACLHILNMGQYPYSIQLPSSNPLASLTTLNYQSFIPNTTLTICHADMPNLSHIIADPASLRFSDPHHENADSVFVDFGKQLGTIEIPDIMLINGAAIPDIHSVLRHCPNLHKFCYNIFAAVLPSENKVLHPSLSVVALKIPASLPASPSVNDEAIKRSLQANVQRITSGLFPALRRIELEIRSGPLSQRLHDDICEWFLSVNVGDVSIVWASGMLQSGSLVF